MIFMTLAHYLSSSNPMTWRHCFRQLCGNDFLYRNKIWYIYLCVRANVKSRHVKKFNMQQSICLFCLLIMWDFLVSGKSLSFYRAEKHKISNIKQDEETSFNSELKTKEKNESITQNICLQCKFKYTHTFCQLYACRWELGVTFVRFC
jgi:hypothetical protein